LTSSSESSDSDLLPRDLEPDDSDKVLFESLPPRPIQVIAQLSEIVHLTPTIPAPLTARHINHKIPVLLVVVDSGIVSVFRTCSFRETVDFALRDESCVRSDPRLVDVEKFEGVLLFVLPFHVLLLVTNWVPPYVQKTVSPGAAADEKGSQVETTTVLGYYEVDGASFAIAHGAACLGVEMVGGEGMGYVQGVVFVDVAIRVLGEVIENVGLKGVRWFHDESVEIHPPKPGQVSLYSSVKRWIPLPFGIWVFSQAIPDRVYLFPALPPFMCVSFLRAHIDDFQIITPSIDVFFLVLHTVPLYRPFPWPFPLHNPTSLIRC
jgi:hypothetical protein